jgi:DNA-binding HxlR family transcriptional regulator
VAQSRRRDTAGNRPVSPESGAAADSASEIGDSLTAADSAGEIADSLTAAESASEIADSLTAADSAPARPESFSSADPQPDPVTLALADALATVGDRWTLLVVAALLEGPRRFSELQVQVYGIAPNVLSQRLRHLERHALVVARPYSRRPPRFTYELTAAGLELAGALRLLADWGARNLDDGSPRHAACGTPVEARWWCPTCERPIDEREIGEVHFA